MFCALLRQLCMSTVASRAILSFVHATRCHWHKCTAEPAATSTSSVVANPEMFEKGGDNISAPSSFITNAHIELYDFYTGKGGYWKKNSEPIRRGGRRWICRWSSACTSLNLTTFWQAYLNKQVHGEHWSGEVCTLFSLEYECLGHQQCIENCIFSVST